MRSVGTFGACLIAIVVSGSGLTWAQETATQATGAEAVPPVADRHDAESGLTLGEDVVGEVFIRSADGDLVAQLHKRSGRRVSVPLDPGQYEIECVTEPQRLHAAVSLGDGEQVVIDRGRLQSQPGKHARSRLLHWLRREPEPARPTRPTYDIRAYRLTVDMGGWADGHGATSVVVTDDGIESHNGGFLGGISWGCRITPEWMFTLGVTSRLIAAHDAGWRDVNAFDQASFLTTLAVGARYYLPPLAAQSAAKPYVSAGVGPTFGTEVKSSDWLHVLSHQDTVRSQAVLGGYVGAGVDLQPTSWLVLGTDVSYHISPKLSDAIDGRRDTKGFAFAFQIGTSFGRRLPVRAGR